MLSATCHIMSEEEAETAALRKKRRIRGAHRASATRLISSLEGAIESGDAPRLKQLKQSLADKASVLMKLDEELIELAEEEKLDYEVEQADMIKERISLAIISIGDAIAAQEATHSSSRRGARHRATSRSSTSSEEEGTLTASQSSLGDSNGHAIAVSSTDASHVMTPPTPSIPLTSAMTSSAPHVTFTLPPSTFPSMAPLLGALPYSMGPSTMTSSTLPAPPTTTFSGSALLTLGYLFHLVLRPYPSTLSQAPSLSLVAPLLTLP